MKLYVAITAAGIAVGTSTLLMESLGVHTDFLGGAIMLVIGTTWAWLINLESEIDQIKRRK